MPFDGNGAYTPPPIPYFPAIPGEVIYAERWNFQWNELYDSLGTVMTRDGQSAMTDNLPMGGFRLTNMGVATAAGMAVEYSQWLAGFTGTTLTSVNIITSAASTPAASSDDTDIANTSWVRTLFGSIPPGSLPGTTGKEGSFLTNDGAGGLSWRSAPPDFVLMNLGVI